MGDVITKTRFSPTRETLTKEDIKARLLVKRQIDPETQCWIWTGNWTKQGAGQIYLPYRQWIYVHKASAHVWLDAPLKGANVVHKKKCSTPACFNPDHLLVVDSLQEICRLQKAGIVRGQTIGEKRHSTKITLEKALQIKAALLAHYAAKRKGKEPELLVDIAERLDVSNDIVRGIHARRSWKYIWDRSFRP
jgi:hypothetical protein